MEFTKEMINDLEKKIEAHMEIEILNNVMAIIIKVNGKLRVKIVDPSGMINLLIRSGKGDEIAKQVSEATRLNWKADNGHIELSAGYVVFYDELEIDHPIVKSVTIEEYHEISGIKLINPAMYLDGKQHSHFCMDYDCIDPGCRWEANLENFQFERELPKAPIRP